MYSALYVAAGKRGNVTDQLSKTIFLFDTGGDLYVYLRPGCENAGHIPVKACLQLTALPSVHMGALLCVWILAYGRNFHGDL